MPQSLFNESENRLAYRLRAGLALLMKLTAQPLTCLVLAGLTVLLAFLSIFTVNEAEYAVVARFGDPRRTISEAGLHLKWPTPVDAVIRVDRRLHVLDPAPEEYLTSDKKNVIVNSFMVWSVEDPVKYLVSLSNQASAEARLSDILHSVVGEVLGSHPFAALVSVTPQQTRMADVIGKITELARARARNDFGVQVAAVRLKRLSFPPDNRQAVFHRMTAERNSIATGIRAEGLEQSEKIKADTDRQSAQLLAEAQRKATELRGEADAEATRIYAEAFSQDPAFYEFQRSLQALEKILNERSTLVIPSNHELLKVLKTPPAMPPSPEQRQE